MRACGSPPPWAANGPVLAERTSSRDRLDRRRPTTCSGGRDPRRPAASFRLRRAPRGTAAACLIRTPRHADATRANARPAARRGGGPARSAPPSLERIRPPSSIPTRSTPASCGLGAIQRTCDVHGRGGKLQRRPRRDSSSARARANSRRRRRCGTAGSARSRVYRAIGRAHREREHRRLGNRSRSRFDRRRRCGALRPRVARHTPFPDRPGRPPGIAPRSRQRQRLPSTRRPPRPAGQSRPRSRHTTAPSTQPMNSNVRGVVDPGGMERIVRFPLRRSSRFSG